MQDSDRGLVVYMVVSQHAARSPLRMLFMTKSVWRGTCWRHQAFHVEEDGSFAIAGWLWNFLCKILSLVCKCNLFNLLNQVQTLINYSLLYLLFGLITINTHNTYSSPPRFFLHTSIGSCLSLVEDYPFKRYLHFWLAYGKEVVCAVAVHIVIYALGVSLCNVWFTLYMNFMSFTKGFPSSIH